MEAEIKVHNISKSFAGTLALKNASLDIKQGEMVALIGPSGSGKSTLLKLISGLLQSNSELDSYIKVHGSSVQKAGKLDKKIRNTRQRIGMIFQQFNLVGALPVLTNVLTGALGKIPLYRSFFGLFSYEEKTKALSALKRVGLEEQVWQRSSTLSGGQQQRVAIARTLMQEAPIILADEPISSLDPESSSKVMEILSTINKEDKKTILICLHQIDYALKYCDRVIVLKEGEIIEDKSVKNTSHDKLRALYKESEDN
jgi:phosphonate transport system ATP-binding protein